jgi:hypothetical protein
MARRTRDTRDKSAGRVRRSFEFEEDIGAALVSRFSFSNTVAGPSKPPKTLHQAASIFPALGPLVRDGEKCSGTTNLHDVNSLRVFERSLSGPIVAFDTITTQMALILWSDGKVGRPFSAEFSFRNRQDDEDFPSEAARLAIRYCGDMQHLDWYLPGARTEMQYVYRDD